MQQDWNFHCYILKGMKSYLHIKWIKGGERNRARWTLLTFIAEWSFPLPYVIIVKQEVKYSWQGDLESLNSFLATLFHFVPSSSYNCGWRQTSNKLCQDNNCVDNTYGPWVRECMAFNCLFYSSHCCFFRFVTCAFFACPHVFYHKASIFSLKQNPGVL